MLSRFYTLVLRYWNATLAALSLVGVAIATLVPTLQEYGNFFIFLCANAVLWTLVEIKTS